MTDSRVCRCRHLQLNTFKLCLYSFSKETVMIRFYTYEAKTLFYFSFQENIENFKCSEELFIAIEILDNTGNFLKIS